MLKWKNNSKNTKSTPKVLKLGEELLKTVKFKKKKYKNGYVLLWKIHKLKQKVRTLNCEKKDKLYARSLKI